MKSQGALPEIIRPSPAEYDSADPNGFNSSITFTQSRVIQQSWVAAQLQRDIQLQHRSHHPSLAAGLKAALLGPHSINSATFRPIATDTEIGQHHCRTLRQPGQTEVTSADCPPAADLDRSPTGCRHCFDHSAVGGTTVYELVAILRVI